MFGQRKNQSTVRVTRTKNAGENHCWFAGHPKNGLSLHTVLQMEDDPFTNSEVVAQLGKHLHSDQATRRPGLGDFVVFKNPGGAMRHEYRINTR